jgi:hypothetical protein
MGALDMPLAINNYFCRATRHTQQRRRANYPWGQPTVYWRCHFPNYMPTIVDAPALKCSVSDWQFAGLSYGREAPWNYKRIASCIATIETALLSGFAGRIDFSAGGMMCLVARGDAGIRYYYQALVPRRVESAEELAGIAYRAQHGTPPSVRSRILRESRELSTCRSIATPIRITDRMPGQSPEVESPLDEAFNR